MQAADKFTTSPVMSGLLIAMRHLEGAKESFYNSLERIGGEEMADLGLAEYEALSNPLRAYVEAQILENIRDWAAAPEMPAEI